MLIRAYTDLIIARFSVTGRGGCKIFAVADKIYFCPFIFRCEPEKTQNTIRVLERTKSDLTMVSAQGNKNMRRVQINGYRRCFSVRPELKLTPQIESYRPG